MRARAGSGSNSAAALRNASSCSSFARFSSSAIWLSSFAICSAAIVERIRDLSYSSRARVNVRQFASVPSAA